MLDYSDVLTLYLKGKLPTSLLMEKKFLKIRPLVQAVHYLQSKGEEAPFDPHRVLKLAQTKFSATDAHAGYITKMLSTKVDNKLLQAVHESLLLDSMLAEVTKQIESGSYEPKAFERLVGLRTGATALTQTLGDTKQSMLEFVCKTGMPAIDRILGGLGAELVIVSARPKVGKALLQNVGLLTPTGWKTHREVQVGDYAVGRNGRPVKIIGKAVWRNRPAYRVHFADGASIDCDAHHEWTVWGRKSSRIETRETQWLATHKRYDGAYVCNWKTVLPSAIEMSPRALPIDPYVLGLWIGDGHWLGGGIHTNSDIVRRRLRERGIAYRDHAENKAFSIPGLKAQLRTLFPSKKVANTKEIPDEYLHSSIEQRRELLQGLFDTDTFFAPNGGIEYVTTSYALARNVQYLVHSLGGTSVVKLKPEPTYTHDGDLRVGQPAYRVFVQLPELRKKKALGREIVAITPLPGVHETVCIQVDAPDGLYVTEDYVVTHNSNFLVNITARQPADKKVLYITIADYGFSEIQYLLNVVDPKIKQRMKSNLRIADLNSMRVTINDIEQCIQEAEPVLTIVDRAEMMEPPRHFSDRTQREQGAIFSSLRQLAKRYNTCVIADAQYSSFGSERLRSANIPFMCSEFMSEDRTQRQAVMDLWFGLHRSVNADGSSEMWVFMEGRRQGRLPAIAKILTNELGVYQ